MQVYDECWFISQHFLSFVSRKVKDNDGTTGSHCCNTSTGVPDGPQTGFSTFLSVYRLNKQDAPSSFVSFRGMFSGCWSLNHSAHRFGPHWLDGLLLTTVNISMGLVCSVFTELLSLSWRAGLDARNWYGQCLSSQSVCKSYVSNCLSIP